MYFKDFNNFLYDFEIKGKREAKIVTDITRNVRFRRDVLANITTYDYYDIQEGDTPEIIAEKFYGNAQYHWIVMLCNERFDYRNDFPLTNPQLNSYVEAKYDNPDDIHHYENENGIVVNSDYPLARPITNRTYEDNVNESKRRIKIVSPAIISAILKNFKDLI
jgi:hypothetical protein